MIYNIIGSRPEYIQAARSTPDGHEESIIATGHTSEHLLIGQPVLVDQGEIIEVVADLLLLQDIEQDYLLVGGDDVQVLAVHADVRDVAVVLVHEVAGQ